MMRHYVSLAALIGAMTLPIAAQNAQLAEQGKAVYASRHCARCHMVAGKGYKQGKLDGVASKMSADDMRRWLTAPKDMEATLEKKPKVKMSSRKGMTLSENEVNALLAYLRTLR